MKYMTIDDYFVSVKGVLRSAFLFVSTLSACLTTSSLNFIKFSVFDTCSYSSILGRQCYCIQCTSSFVDEI